MLRNFGVNFIGLILLFGLVEKIDSVFRIRFVFRMNRRRIIVIFMLIGCLIFGMRIKRD